MIMAAEKTPMQQALAALFEAGACDASAEQIAEIASRFGVETWKLEGFYFDEVERIANE
jgi:hypothetical protein